MSATYVRSPFDTYPARQEWLVAATDLELVVAAYQLVGDAEDDALRDNFCALMTEMFERWVPEAAWAECVAAQKESTPGDVRIELEATLEAMGDRAAARVEARFSVDKAVAS